MLPSVTDTFATTPDAMQNDVQEISASSAIDSAPLQKMRSNVCVPESVSDSPTPIVRSAACVSETAVATAMPNINRFILWISSSFVF